MRKGLNTLQPLNEVELQNNLGNHIILNGIAHCRGPHVTDGTKNNFSIITGFFQLCVGIET